MSPDNIGMQGEQSPDAVGINIKTGVSRQAGINEAIESRNKIKGARKTGK